jgi:hypothetical protein
MPNRPDDLRRQIGSLWKTAKLGIDAMRDVVLRSSQTGRLRVDIALLHNERAHLLQQLGEELVRRIDDGSFDDVSDELRALHEQVKDVEGRIKSDSARATDNAYGARRGFEPEAAADYGDEGGAPDADETPARQPPKKKRASKRKENHRH